MKVFYNHFQSIIFQLNKVGYKNWLFEGKAYSTAYGFPFGLLSSPYTSLPIFDN